MSLRNSFISLSNRMGIYNALRDSYYKMRIGNSRRRKFLARFFSSQALCFDVGSNIGETADLFRSLGVKVIAIEPHQECAAYLRNKYKNDDKVIVVEKAISSQEGLSEMYSCEANQLSSLSPEFIRSISASRRFGKLPLFHKVPVNTTTLETLIKEYGRPAFLKVDVEGFEHEVFEGLKSRIPFICFEYTFPENRRSFDLCIRHLDGLGTAEYNATRIDHSGFMFPQWSCRQHFLQLFKKELDRNSSGNVYVKYDD